jgi:formate hydrogenlyase subunit 3/multisubunit Na+/H+ antiporter MnhD subunit
MTTFLRKLLMLAVIAVVLVLASIYEVVRWLTHLGVPEMADRVSERYLTGTTIAVVVALVFLLRSDRRRHEQPDEPPYWRYRPRPRWYRDWWERW